MLQYTEFNKACLLLKYHTVLRYTRKCNFIYARKNNAVFLPVIFTERKMFNNIYAYLTHQV